MSTTRFRRAIIVLAVCVGVVALAAPVQALTVKGSTTDIKWHFSKPKQDAILKIRTPEGRSTIQVIDAGELVARVSTGSTGQGESEEECADRGRVLNLWLDLMNSSYHDNDMETAAAAGYGFAQESEDALAAGCFIVYGRQSQEPPTG